MRILIASTPATGHLNPLLSIGRLLLDRGHEVTVLSATAMRKRIEAVGATFRCLPDAADFDLRRIESVCPEIKDIPPGPEMTLYYLKRVYFDVVPAQSQRLREALRDFPADVILADNFFFGVFPLLLGPRAERPAIALCGTMPLHAGRDDGAPNFAGLLPAQTRAERDDYAAIARQHDSLLNVPGLRHLNGVLAGLGIKPLDMRILEAAVCLPDAYLQMTVPSFEFPRMALPSSVHFVGVLPIVKDQAPLPVWAGELDGSRKVVLVTQGTFSNHDFDQLVVPAMMALANEPDVLVVVTTGGRSLDALPGTLPDDVRAARYLPFDWLLPKVDAFVTNGGYGSINQALSFGVPVIGAGLTEDKADVNARVGWSGVGIDLATNAPTPAALRGAIRAVLDTPTFRAEAKRMAREFDSIDTGSAILDLLAALARSNSPLRQAA